MNERRDVISSRRAICQAYLDLSSENPQEAITASQLIEKSGLSRATFYAHYSDVHQVQKGIQDDFIELTVQTLIPYLRQLFLHTDRAVFQILRFFDINKKMIQAITMHGRNHTYYAECRQEIGKILLRNVFVGKITEDRILKAMILASMIMDQAKDTVQNHLNYTVPQRAAVLTQRMQEGISAGE